MTIVVTGSASGMGRATAAMLAADGTRVIGVDRADAEVTADLGDPAGRAEAAEAVARAANGVIDGIATFAGVSGFGGRSGAEVVRVNYFGTVGLLAALRPQLAAAGQAAAVAVGSNSATTTRGLPTELVDACLAGDEDKACALAESAGGRLAYAASKLAVMRWVRRVAPTSDWIGAGINLNALVPGHVDTAMTRAIGEDPVGRKALARAELPVGRAGTVDELAAFAAFLLGPACRFFVGSVLFQDGGTDAVVNPDTWPRPVGGGQDGPQDPDASL